MTHEIHYMVTTIVFGTVDANMASVEWDLVLNWCLAAAQHDTKGGSLVAFVVDTVTEGDGKYLG